MASQALQAFRRTITVDWPKSADVDAKTLLVKTARQGHANIMAAAQARGVTPTFEAYANTPGNTRLESVVLPGPIVYNYRYLRDLVQVALDELRRASPVVSSDYVRSHTVYVNGVQVDVLPTTIGAGDEIFISNPVPYARRIEIGKTEAGRDFVLQVPNRIYERVAKNILIPRFRNVAKISFSYITPPESYRYKKDNAARSWLAKKQRWYVQPKQRADRAKGAVVRSPAIIISSL